MLKQQGANFLFKELQLVRLGIFLERWSSGSPEVGNQNTNQRDAACPPQESGKPIEKVGDDHQPAGQLERVGEKRSLYTNHGPESEFGDVASGCLG